MNNKKLLAAIVALTMSATTAVAMSGCNTHKHNYQDWTETKAPTCTLPGVEEGTCPDDGATTTREIPALGHDYGEWVITEAPTESSEGKATKICANDSAHDHVIEVTLPSITIETHYTVKKLKETPTYVQSQYTFAHEEGDIVFVANVTKQGISAYDLSVKDAVTTAIDPYYSSLVGIVEGSSGTKFTYFDNENKEVTRETNTPFLYELGDNYVHVKYGYDEYWLDKGDDGISGIVSDGYDYYLATANDVDYMSGVPFTNPFSNEKCYGAEELLDSLYASATESADYNKAFDSETPNKHNGAYYFEWTVLESTFSNSVGTGVKGEVMSANTDTLYKAQVEFTLDNNFMLTSLSLSYDKYTYQYEVEETVEGSGIYVAKGDLPYVHNENDNTYEPNPEDAPDAHYEINVEQSGYPEILPINPWVLEELVVNSFRMLTGGQVTKDYYDSISDDDEDYVKEFTPGKPQYNIEDSYVVKEYFEEGDTLNIKTSDVITVYLADFAPEKAAEYASLNPVHVYLVMDDGEEILIAASDSYPSGTPVVSSYYQQSFILKSRENTGDFTIKVCVGDATRTFKLHVDESAPEELVTNVNVYNDSKGSYDVKTVNSITVYEGKDLTFEVGVGNFEDPYDIYTCDPSSTVSLKDNYEGVSLTVKDGVWTFNATTKGVYVINVVSTLDASVKTTLTVTVDEAPDVDFDTEYEAGDFTVTFNDGKVSVSDGKDVNVEFDYTYVDGVLTANSSDNKFSLELTENYTLVLVYVDDYNDTNRYVLKDASIGLTVEDALAGTTWTYNDIYITFNADGTLYTGNQYEAIYGGTATYTWELTDKGDGTYSFTFEEVNDPSGGYYSLLLPDSNKGSELVFNGSEITRLTINLEGAWAGIKDMTKSN